jgi:hypothetical protein
MYSPFVDGPGMFPRWGARHGIIGAMNGGMVGAMNAPMQAMQAPGCLPMVPVMAAEACTDAGAACRVYPLNFRQNAVPAGATITIQAQPQKAFRPTKIVCPSSIADRFLLQQLEIGTNPQIADNSGAGTLLQVFSEAAQDVGVMFDLARPGIIISCRVENIDANPSNFFLTLLGPAVDNYRM